VALLRTANMLFWGRGSRMGSAMVPLDRALLSSYRLSIVNIPLSVTVWPQFAMQILTEVRPPNLPFPWGTNGVSFRPTASVECTSVTDGQTDRPRYGNICRNWRDHFQRCRLIIIIIKNNKIRKCQTLCGSEVNWRNAITVGSRGGNVLRCPIAGDANVLYYDRRTICIVRLDEMAGVIVPDINNCDALSWAE